MIVSTHQPLYLPWPGLFAKAAHSDLLVLLDHVPFPMGRSFVSRNRLKNDRGPFWLTVPVKRRGRSNDPINVIEIDEGRNWRAKQSAALRQAYAHAPYLTDHLAFFEDFFARPRRRLIDLNMAAIRHLASALGISTRLALSSEMGITARGTALPIEVCRKAGADIYLAAAASAKYLDERGFGDAGIRIDYRSATSPTYPQLWGSYAANLSVLDMLLCCGPRSRALVDGSLKPSLHSRGGC